MGVLSSGSFRCDPTSFVASPLRTSVAPTEPLGLDGWACMSPTPAGSIHGRYWLLGPDAQEMYPRQSKWLCPCHTLQVRGQVYIFKWWPLCNSSFLGFCLPFGIYDNWTHHTAWTLCVGAPPTSMSPFNSPEPPPHRAWGSCPCPLCGPPYLCDHLVTIITLWPGCLVLESPMMPDTTQRSHM